MTDTRTPEQRIAEIRSDLSDRSADARAYFIRHLREALATCLAEDADVRALKSSSEVAAKRMTDAVMWALWNGSLSRIGETAIAESRWQAEHGLDRRSTVTEAADAPVEKRPATVLVHDAGDGRVWRYERDLDVAGYWHRHSPYTLTTPGTVRDSTFLEALLWSLADGGPVAVVGSVPGTITVTEPQQP